MSTSSAWRCAAMLILLIKLTSGADLLQPLGEAAEVLEEELLGDLEAELEAEELIGGLRDELDELEMEERNMDILKRGYYQAMSKRGVCFNKNNQCHAWSCRGECLKNPAYMLPNCQWNCGACGPSLRTCANKKADCHAWMLRGECYKNPRYMFPNCCFSCMSCNKIGQCQDLHKDCAYWACRGECIKNPFYMLINCRKSCNVCYDTAPNQPVPAGTNCPKPQGVVALPPRCNEKVDIAVLMDGSASVGTGNFPKVRDFVLNLASGFNIGPKGALIAVYQYAISFRKEVGLTQFKNRQDLLKAIQGISFINGGGTLTGGSLTKVHQDLTPANGARPGVKKVIILITDGIANDDVEQPSQYIKSKGVLISTVGVANADVDQLKAMASGKEFVVNVGSFGAMANVRDKVLNAICRAQQKRGLNTARELSDDLQYLELELGALIDKIEETKK